MIVGGPMDDATKCPLCGGSNACALASSEAAEATECWCVRETFPATLLKRVPDESRNRACICRQCLRNEEAKALGR
ncbi:MAG: hypothetical protein E4H00_05380 [Myxococcales bacterium]|nr:MAG: hypothetical protein E4H00_05380 [Myxococcales bacterium]